MDFHTVQSEKAKAIARYNRVKYIAKIWRFFEAILAVFVLSWSSTFARFFSEAFAYVCKYAYSPLATFLAFNSIIAVLVLLSRKNRDEEEREEGEVIKMALFEESDFEIPGFSPDFMEEDVKMVVFDQTEEKNKISEKNEIFVMKNEFLPSKNECLRSKNDFLLAKNDYFPKKSDLKKDFLSARVLPCGAEEEEREKRIVVVERDEGEKAVIVAIEEAKKQIQRFKRTQSDILKRDITPHQRFQRSETEKAISVVSKVDTLSSEDFQRTVEEFIAKQQKFLLDQKMAEKQD